MTSVCAALELLTIKFHVGRYSGQGSPTGTNTKRSALWMSVLAS